MQQSTSIRLSKLILFFTLYTFFWSCSSTKHLEEEDLLLNKVTLTTSDKHLKTTNYRMYIRQDANARWFNLFKVPLGFYNISGRDSTKHINHFFQRIGEPPVAYRPAYTKYSINALTSALQSRGFIHAKVKVDSVIKKRKINLKYELIPGPISYIRRSLWQA